MKRLKNNDAPWQFIEFMACPGGCIGGGGQPRSAVPPTDEVRKARMKSLYQLDKAKSGKHASYENAEIQALYEEDLGKPLGERAEKLLHTQYTDRSRLLSAKKE